MRTTYWFDSEISAVITAEAVTKNPCTAKSPAMSLQGSCRHPALVSGVSGSFLLSNAFLNILHSNDKCADGEELVARGQLLQHTVRDVQLLLKLAHGPQTAVALSVHLFLIPARLADICFPHCASGHFSLREGTRRTLPNIWENRAVIWQWVLSCGVSSAAETSSGPRRLSISITTVRWFQKAPRHGPQATPSYCVVESPAEV